MVEQAVLTRSGYAKLVGDLRKILSEGKKRAQAAVGRQLVETYWQLGKRISKEEMSVRAGYNFSVLEDMARELGMEYNTLRRAFIFFQKNPVLTPRRQNTLTWSHYLETLPIEPQTKRNWYEDASEREEWTRDQLRSAIKRNAYDERGANGKHKSSHKLRRPTAATFVYKALVERVIDGDTLRGRKAFEYVRDQLARTSSVIVKTNKIDIYGRYIGDVFYDYGEKHSETVFQKGRHLNQELVSRGLAKRV